MVSAGHTTRSPSSWGSHHRPSRTISIGALRSFATRSECFAMTDHEDPLALAIRAYVDGAASTVTAAEVMHREPSPGRDRRRRRALIAGVAVATAAAMAFAVFGTGRTTRQRVAT